MTPNKEWFYLQAGQQTGPVATEEILVLVKSGRLQAGDSIWKAGLPQWVPVNTRPEFSAAVVKPPTAPPPVPSAPRKSGWPLWVKVLLAFIVLGVLGFFAIIILTFFFVFNAQKEFTQSVKKSVQQPSLIHMIDVEGSARRAQIPVAFLPREFHGYQLEFLKSHEASGTLIANYVGAGKLDLRIANKGNAASAEAYAESLKGSLGAGLDFKESGQSTRFSSAFSPEKKQYITIWSAGKYAVAVLFSDREAAKTFINPYVSEILKPHLASDGE